MDDNRKSAYRYLIYWAMVEIRALQWQARPSWRLLNPLEFYRVWKMTRRSGAIAEWLHNAALFSTFDFERFSEDWFWKEYEGLVRKFGDAGWNYRAIFEAQLKDQSRPEITRS